MIRLLRNFSLVLVISSFCLHGMEQGQPKTLLQRTQEERRAIEKKALLEGAWILWALEHTTPHEQHLDLIQKHLEMGANANYADKNGVTLLMKAIKNNNIDQAALLIKHGAKVNAKTQDGSTPLDYAVWYGSPDIIRLLLDNKATIDKKGAFGMTPLHTAVEKGKAALVIDLLKANANPNIANSLKNMPLHTAVKYNMTPAIAQQLIEKGAQVNAQDNKGNTILHLIAHGLTSSSWLEFLPYLLQHGADINAQNLLGETPLFVAASTGDWRVAARLLQLGANPTLETIRGQTILQFLETALQNPDINPRDKARYETILPLIKAAATGEAPIATQPAHPLRTEKTQKGISHIIASKWSLFDAIKANNFDKIKLLLDQKMNPDVIDSKGMTPLHYAAQNNNIQLAKLLFQHKANINAQDENGDTPLHIAVRAGNDQIVKSLLAQNANPTIKNKNGETALEWFELNVGLFPQKKELLTILALLQAASKGVPTTPSYFPPTTQPAPGGAPAEVPVPTGKQVVAAKEALQNAPIPRSKAQLLKGALIGLGALATTYGLYYYLTLQVPTNLTPTELETQIVMALQNKNYDYANKLADSNPQAIAGLSPQQRQELEQVIDTTIIQASREAAKIAGTYNLLGYFQPPLPEQLRLLHNLAHTIERGESEKKKILEKRTP